MSEKTRLALGILAASALLGLAGNWLLWSADWGINLGLWLAVAVGAVFALQRWARPERLPGGPWSLVAALAFAFAFAWRDSPWLRTLDVLVLAVALTLPFWRPAAGSLRRALVGDAAAGAGHAAGMAVAGWSFVLDPGIRWAEVNRSGSMRHGVGVLVGLAIALPLLLIFGALFMSADARFEELVKGAFSLNADEFVGRCFVIAILTWGTGGFLYGALWPRVRAAGSGGPGLSLGIVAVSTVLVLLDALFGAFVALQLPYLFGGAGLVAQSEGLTYAEYARRGFFELAMVTTLALPLLLALHALIGRPQAPAAEGEEPRLDAAAATRAQGVFRWLAGAMLVLLGVIIASAVQRMGLYQAEFGWTTARLYVLAFEGWLGVVLVWFALTVLRDRREDFLFGAIAWGMVATALLHLPNWEELVVRHNVALAAQGRPVSPSYLEDLSLDAVPALAQAMPSLRGEMASAVAFKLKGAYEQTKDADWRSWRWSQHAARETLAGRKAELEALTKPAFGPGAGYGYPATETVRQD